MEYNPIRCTTVRKLYRVQTVHTLARTHPFCISNKEDNQDSNSHEWLVQSVPHLRMVVDQTRSEFLYITSFFEGTRYCIIIWIINVCRGIMLSIDARGVMINGKWRTLVIYEWYVGILTVEGQSELMTLRSVHKLKEFMCIYSFCCIRWLINLLFIIVILVDGSYENWSVLVRLMRHPFVLSVKRTWKSSFLRYTVVAKNQCLLLTAKITQLKDLWRKTRMFGEFYCEECDRKWNSGICLGWSWTDVARSAKSW